MRVFVGYDPREHEAYEVAVRSMSSHTPELLNINSLKLDLLRQMGVYRREVVRDDLGRMWDLQSSAPMSTEFALTRFFVPYLVNYEGWALFVDCDVVVLGDLRELFDCASPEYAVMCVPHDYLSQTGQKMNGQVQTAYRRKNWSSVMLMNCGHEAWGRLNDAVLNTWPGVLLHQFCWLRDSEIGTLPPEWNWLVGVQSKPAEPKLAHFTLGGPWLEGWAGAEHDELWLGARGS